MEEQNRKYLNLQHYTRVSASLRSIRAHRYVYMYVQQYSAGWNVEDAPPNHGPAGHRRKLFGFDHLLERTQNLSYVALRGTVVSMRLLVDSRSVSDGRQVLGCQSRDKHTGEKRFKRSCSLCKYHRSWLIYIRFLFCIHIIGYDGVVGVGQ